MSHRQLEHNSLTLTLIQALDFLSLVSPLYSYLAKLSFLILVQICEQVFPLLHFWSLSQSGAQLMT